MKKIIAAGLVVLLLAAGFIYFSQNSKPIKIAFVGELSTSSSQLSVESREAFLYAVEQCNQSGGINGRLIEPYIYDDRNDNGYKETLHQQLQADGIELIIGFNISAMVETIEYLMASGDYLIISPTVTTDYMTGRDDRFIKTSPTNAIQADELIKVVKTHDVKRMVIVYSQPNKLFAEGIVNRMTELIKLDGREVSQVIADDGSVDVKTVQAALKAHQADGLFLVLNGNDSAQMIQDTRIGGYQGQIFTSAWAGTMDLINNSGRNGNGVYSVEITPHDPDEATGKALAAYIKSHTNSELNFSHTRSYNATQMLIEALKQAKQTNPETVKQKIIEIGTFQGVESQFTVDPFGDTLGTYQLKQIQDGKFVKVR